MNLERIAEVLAGSGLIIRGGFHPQPVDLVPALSNGQAGGTVVIVGNAGPAMWRVFRDAPERTTRGHPLNTWTRRVMDAIADELAAEVAYPFSGPPYHPFQRWAQKVEPVWPSPIGILIHAQYGLWHGYRAALIFGQHLALPDPVPVECPCDSCVERPCLSTCPVSAFSAEGYDVPRCISHLAREEGRDCIELGCRARRHCPVGVDYQFESAQAELHMQAFFRSNPG